MTTVDSHLRQPLKTIESLSTTLMKHGHRREGAALQQVVDIACKSPDYGGMGLSPDQRDISKEDTDELIFLASACEQLHSSYAL